MILDSGFLALDSGLQVLDSRFYVWPGDLRFRIIIVSVICISCPVFRIPKPRIPDFTNKISRIPESGFPTPFRGANMERKWQESKGDEESLVEWSELLPLDQHLRFAFSHLTERERQRKLGKNRLENDQILSARAICPVSVFIFQKFFVTFIFCLLSLQINDILNNLKLAHILRFSSGLFEFARPFFERQQNWWSFLVCN